MKTILQFAFIFFVSGMIRSQDCGKVVIRNAGNHLPKFIISLNGVRITNEYGSSVTFNCLDMTKYTVKVLQAGSGNPLMYVLNSEPNYVSKYVINRDNFGNYSFLLESKSLLSAEPESLPGATFVTQPVVITEPVRTPTIIPANTVVSTPTVVIAAIGDADFNDRLAAVKKESFDREKLEKAKSVFGDETLNTTQVRNVMKQFSFDDAKLDFAKFAYSRTIDQRNYYKVEDEFSFSSSRKKLSDYVKTQK